jgi:hypothetical protein
MPVIPAIVGSIRQRIVVQASIGKKRNTVSNITRTKRAADMTQVVELLPKLSNKKSGAIYNYQQTCRN